MSHTSSVIYWVSRNLDFSPRATAKTSDYEIQRESLCVLCGARAEAEETIEHRKCGTV